MARIKRGVGQRGNSQQPRNPKLVLKIIRLKDEEGMKWRQIAKEVDMSHFGAFETYWRWRNRPWYLNNTENS